MDSDQIRTRREELEKELAGIEDIPVMFPSDTTRENERDRIFGQMDELKDACSHPNYTTDQMLCPDCRAYRPTKVA